MKPLIHVPTKKYIVVQALKGQVGLVIDVYGRCRSCEVMVWLCREKPQDQWVPVKTDESDLHVCPGELKRNQKLRELLYGPDPTDVS